MDGFSAHQLSLYSKKPSYRNLDIRPRKLLTHRLAALSSEPSMEINPSTSPSETLFPKFMNNSPTDEDSDPYPKKPSYRNLDIPPRKLLTHRLAALSSEPSMEIRHNCASSNPRVSSSLEETLFHKFLGNSIADEDSDPYASDDFRMYEFKIRKCTRSRSHDWTDCPFAHPGEKARRRCPRRFGYSGAVCAEFRLGGTCVRGDTCDFSHGVFECWLHPSRYRTEACKDGKNCQRKICFFAHTTSQLRSPLETVFNHSRCGHCRYTTSPTSILDMNKQTPPSSPVLSPISCFSRKELMKPQGIRELMNNMKAMNMNEIDEAPNLNSLAACNDDQHSFFSVSPSTPFTSSSGSSRFVNESSSKSGPDINWVSDLLT